jgi:hypothetical protein
MDGPAAVTDAGRLVLSGSGEFVYLRGDRQDDDRLVPIEWEGQGPDD